MMKPLPAPAALLLMTLVAGCSPGHGDGEVAVSAIGEPPALRNINVGRVTAADAAVIAAVDQGLVRHDESGQVEPAIAIRWAISDDGLFYTFRLGREYGLTSTEVARQLSSKLQKNSSNPAKPLLDAVDEIVAVTPEVLEIRLSAPRPDLLEILARPEMGLRRKQGGTGPLKIVDDERGVLVLQRADVSEIPEADDEDRRELLFRGERAALAIARYQSGAANLVLGGRFQHVPLVQAAGVRARDWRIDPVVGLFGLKIQSRQGFLASGENRRALSMAIDRNHILAAFGVPGWAAAQTIVPPGTYDLPRPVQPGWTDAPLGVRRGLARRAVADWRDVNPEEPAPHVRIALPAGPGGRLLFRLLRADLLSIGVTSDAVGLEDEAELRLVDVVAPVMTASWALSQFRCSASPICSQAADFGLDLAATTRDPIERSARLANADLRLAEITPFIPIAQPLRWSLAGPRLPGFQTNYRGVHPLNNLLLPPG